MSVPLVVMDEEKALKIAFGFMRQYFDYFARLDDLCNIIKNYFLTKYKLCQFSDEFTSHQCGNTLSNDRYLLKKTQNGAAYAILDSKNGFGFDQNDETSEDGEYCWRIYVQYGIRTEQRFNLIRQWKWFLIGVSQFGIKLGDHEDAQYHHRTFAVCGNGNDEANKYDEYRKGGKYKTYGPLSFLYENGDIKQIDMLLDCKKRTLSYKLVAIDDDNDNDNKREFTIRYLHANVKWVPLFDCRYQDGKLQVAQIKVSMYGKNKDLVQWPIQYQV